MHHLRARAKPMMRKLLAADDAACTSWIDLRGRAVVLAPAAAPHHCFQHIKGMADSCNDNNVL